MSAAPADTIVAIATAAGHAGVGIVRLSGPQARSIAEGLCRVALRPRHAHHVRIRDADGELLDDAIALWFAAPASYTGEDMVELQGHGNPLLLQALVDAACAAGARIARPGEFSERAFLAGKLDLAQAEALADLIVASDTQALRAARRSLDGGFSRQVDALMAAMLQLRVQVEAAIDFADEPIETLGDAALRAHHATIAGQLEALLAAAEQGQRLRDGLHVVIVGPPNAGKSALLNALAGSERAIVTEVAGTTRDLLREQVRIGGIELTLVDSAGLRAGGDAIEREGMRRARAELQRADLALVVLDARDPQAGMPQVEAAIAAVPRRLVVHNKLDLLPTGAIAPGEAIAVSALRGDGLPQLRERLQALAGGSGGTGSFSVRARHVDALRRAAVRLAAAGTMLEAGGLELAAEDLRLAHDALGEIGGTVDADRLLGHIFASFCIGK